MNLFYESIDLSIGNGKTSMFWHTPWLDGAQPKDLAPSIYNISKKNFSVSKGLEQKIWISNLSFEGGIVAAHITEFSNIWTKTQEIHLNDEPDTITWKLTNDNAYSSAMAYLAQFYAPPTSFMIRTVWNNCPHPKCKTFAWLILQNRV
jgi:hypothetical protein